MDPTKIMLRNLIAGLDAAVSDEQKVMALQMAFMQLAQSGDHRLAKVVAPAEKKMADAFLDVVPVLRGVLYEFERSLP